MDPRNKLRLLIDKSTNKRIDLNKNSVKTLCGVHLESKQKDTLIQRNGYILQVDEKVQKKQHLLLNIHIDLKYFQ